MTPIDFLVAAEPVAADPHHHALLFANCLAQSEAFMRGRTLEEAKALLRKEGPSEAEIERLAPHKVFSGDRPSSTLLIENSIRARSAASSRSMSTRCSCSR